MAKVRIGLDIGSTSVRIAEVAQGDRPAVTRLGQVPLPAGAVEGGEIRDVGLVTAALGRLLDVSGVKPGPVYLGFASSKVIVRDVTLPWIAEKELREALGFQVAEYIPMALEDSVLDFQTLEEASAEDPQRTRRILLVAAQKGPVLAAIDAAQAAGLEPIGVDLSPFAAVRALGAESTSRSALVDIGGDVTCIALHRGLTVELVRILATGGGEITARIARELGIEPTTAEILKRGEADADLAPDVDRRLVRESAMRAVGGLVDEIASTIDFSVRQTGGVPIDRIVLTGGGSHFGGIVEILDERMPGVTVERARVFSRARSRLVPELGAMVEAGRGFSVAIGLALPDDRPDGRSARRRAAVDAASVSGEEPGRGRSRRRKTA